MDRGVQLADERFEKDWEVNVGKFRSMKTGWSAKRVRENTIDRA